MVKNQPSSYPKQWATIFILLYGQKTLKVEDVTKLLSPILVKWDTKELPVIYVVNSAVKNQKITTGPWKGRDTTNKGPIITAIKWNVRKLDEKEVNDNDLGDIRANYRSKIIPLLAKLGIASEYIAARIYKTPFDKNVDKGLPKTPDIPPEPRKINWWLWGGGAIAGLFVLHKVKKALS